MHRKAIFFAVLTILAFLLWACEDEPPLINIIGGDTTENSCVACHTDPEVLAADIAENPVPPPAVSKEIEGMG